MKDYYEILTITKEEKKLPFNEFSLVLKKKYRDLSKQHHPDKNNGNKDSETKFQEISEAYNVLSNKDKKENYDRGGQHRFSNRQHYKPDIVGENMSLVVKLTLEEVHNGVTKKYKYNKNQHCSSCEGKGGTGSISCSKCNGDGIVNDILVTPVGRFQHQSICDVCNGFGSTYEAECGDCSGNGITNIEETIEVEIPSGVANGMAFVMYGKGHAIKNGRNGNLVIQVVELKHQIFTRVDSTLKMNLTLNYPQLVLGDKVEVETIDGSKIRVTIPEYSNVGTNLRVPNKGLNVFQSTNRGDLIINLGIDIPKDLNEKTRALIEELKENL